MVSRRVQGLVLSHLALLVGCDGPRPPEPTVVSPEPPPEPPAVVVEPTPTATAEPTAPTTSASTVATNDPPPAPSASVGPPGSGGIGAPCHDRSDCKDGLHCRLGFTGAEFIKPGECAAERPVYKGRPLVVAGERHEAPLGPDSGWLGATPTADPDPGLAAELRAAAREEHAAVAAFGRTLVALCALGAPPHLLRGTQEAIADEIRHTQICLRWAEALDGVAQAPGALPAATAPFADDLAVDLLVDVFRGGCVGETLAAAELLAQAADCEGALAADLEAMAEDESRHAALAFATVHWLVATHPELEARLATERERFRDRAEPHHRRLVEPLLDHLA